MAAPADKGALHLQVGVGIQHVVLDIAVLVRLEGLGVVNLILNDHRIHIELDRAGLSRHAGGGIDNLALALVPVCKGKGAHGHTGNLLVVHIQNPGPGGRSVGQADLNVLNGPCVAGNCNDLLVIGLAVDGHGDHPVVLPGRVVDSSCIAYVLHA